MTADLRAPFHLAFPVHDLAAARRFYGELLGCEEGRSADTWIDFNLHGHQIVAHLAPSATPDGLRAAGVAAASQMVDGHEVPVPHFGLVLPTLADWEALSDRLVGAPDARIVIPPTVRFRGQPGEQATVFVQDPSGNALEFKAFADLGQLFAR